MSYVLFSPIYIQAKSERTFFTSDFWTISSTPPPQTAAGEIRQKVQIPLCRHRLR